MTLIEKHDAESWDRARKILKEKWGKGYDIVQLSIFENDENDELLVEYKAIHYTVRSSDDRPFIKVKMNKNFEMIK